MKNECLVCTTVNDINAEKCKICECLLGNFTSEDDYNHYLKTIVNPFRRVWVTLKGAEKELEDSKKQNIDLRTSIEAIQLQLENEQNRADKAETELAHQINYNSQIMGNVSLGNIENAEIGEQDMFINFLKWLFGSNNESKQKKEINAKMDKHIDELIQRAEKCGMTVTIKNCSPEVLANLLSEIEKREKVINERKFKK